MRTEFILPKSVKRVSVLREGAALPTEIVSAAGRKTKKQSAGFRTVGQWVHRYGKAVAEVSDVYVRRHKRSNEKKRDGWFRDLAYNVTKAGRSGLSKLRMPVFRF